MAERTIRENLTESMDDSNILKLENPTNSLNSGMVGDNDNISILLQDIKGLLNDTSAVVKDSVSKIINYNKSISKNFNSSISNLKNNNVTNNIANRNTTNENINTTNLSNNISNLKNITENTSKNLTENSSTFTKNLTENSSTFTKNLTEKNDVINNITRKHSEETKQKISESLKTYHENKRLIQNQTNDSDNTDDNITRSITSIPNNIINGFSKSIDVIGDKVTPIFEKVYNTFENLYDSISDGIKNVADVITGNITDIMGSELNSLFNDVKGIMGGIFKTATGAFSLFTGGLFGETDDKNLNENKEQTGLLKSMVNIFKLREKREAVKFDDDGNPLIDALIQMVAVTTGVIVGYLSQALSPFKSLTAVVKPFTKDGFVFKLFSKIIPERLSYIRTIGTKISGVFAKIGRVFSSVIESIRSSSVFKFGAIIGKFLFWFRFLFDTVKEIFSQKSIRDKILGISAKLISLVGEIPELILNGLLKLFGSEFRVDFGKDAIINAVNKFSDWLFPNFTVPVLDFFTIDIPNMFKKFVGFFDLSNLFNMDMGTIVEKIKGILSTIFAIPLRIQGWIFDKVKGIFQKLNIFEFLNRDSDDGIMNNVSGFIKDIFNTPSKLKDWVFDKVKGINDKIKNIFGIFDSEDNELDEGRIENIKKVIGFITNMPNKIKRWLKGKIENIISKIPDFLLPKSLENFTFDDASASKNKTKDMGKQVKPTELPKIEINDNGQRKELSELKAEAKNTNKLLNKLVKATEKNGKKADEVNNATIVNQNNVSGGGSGKEIPEENEWLGINILNGAFN